MTNQLDNLKGERFGFLSVVDRLPNDVYGNVWWACTCVCGEQKCVRASALRNGKFFNCGKIECRFWSKVYRPEGDGCWLWTGGLKEFGHGAFKANGRCVGAHQFSWVLANGPVPCGKLLRHTCDVPACVRPTHIVLGTHQNNMDDMVERGRAHGGGGPKITEDVVRVLRDEYATGQVTQPQLADRHGQSVALVRRAINGVTWAQVH